MKLPTGLDYQKAMHKAEKLIQAAKNERDTKGMRENLGYDQENKLRDFLAPLDLLPQQRYAVIDWYLQACDNL